MDCAAARLLFVWGNRKYIFHRRTEITMILWAIWGVVAALILVVGGNQ